MLRCWLQVRELQLQLQTSRPHTSSLQEATIREEYESRITVLEKKLARSREAKTKLETAQEKLHEKTNLASSLLVRLRSLFVLTLCGRI